MARCRGRDEKKERTVSRFHFVSMREQNRLEKGRNEGKREGVGKRAG